MIKVTRNLCINNVIFIDNSSTHSNLSALRNVNIKFLPYYTMSELQVFDKRSFEASKSITADNKLLDAIDEGIPSQISMYLRQ